MNMKLRNKYKAIIIGCGNIGCTLERYNPGFVSTHLMAYKKNPEIDIIALCDIDNNKCKMIANKYNIPFTFDNLEEAMKTIKPEIVSICTPDEVHYKILKEVAKFDCVKGIWCEKPIATSIKQAEEMIKYCKDKDIKLLVNYIKRYDLFYRNIKERLGDLVGEIQTVVCYYSGGIVTTGSHLVDLLNYYFGACLSVSAETNLKTGLVGKLVYESKVFVNLIPCDGNYFSIMELDIIGSKARLDLINKPFGNYDYRYYPTQKYSGLNMKFISGVDGRPLNRNIKRDFFELALSDLITCMENNISPISSGGEALKSLDIISALAYSSDHNGKIIKLPFKKKGYKIPEAEGDIRKWKS